MSSAPARPPRPPGFGTAGSVVGSILEAFPGATSEAIDYPAVGDDAYAASIHAGVAAVVDQVDSLVAECPGPGHAGRDARGRVLKSRLPLMVQYNKWAS